MVSVPEQGAFSFECGVEDSAPSKETVKEVLSQEGIPYDGIYRVQIFDVASRTLKA